MTFKRTHKAGRNFLLKGEKRAKGHSQCLTNLASSFKCHPKVKGNSKIYPRRNFKDRRDEGGGAVLETPPYISSLFISLCQRSRFIVSETQKSFLVILFSCIRNFLFYFSICVGEVILNDFINCSFNFLIVFFI